MNLARVAAVSLLTVAVTGCAGSASTQPSPTGKATPTVPPTVVPTPTPGDFTVTILPAEEPVASRVAIPGEKVSFLVVVTDASGGKWPVTIAATAEGAAITAITPAQLEPGVVGEVWLVPAPSDVEATATVHFTASRAGIAKTDTRTISIFPMKDERAKDAAPYFAMWTAWLAAQHPELKITATTKWDPAFVSTFLVVSHYAYFSDEWEMKVSWHNMIAPYDWTEVYLRHRFDESKPSLAFRIDSVSGKTAAHAVTPPDAIMR